MNLKNTSKGMVNITVKTVIYLAVAALIYQLSVTGFTLGQKVFSESGYKEAPGKNISVTISKSMSKLDVARLLEDKGIVENKWIFYLQSFLYESDYKSGKYKLNTSSSPEELIVTLSAGENKGEEK